MNASASEFVPAKITTRIDQGSEYSYPDGDTNSEIDTVLELFDIEAKGSETSEDVEFLQERETDSLKFLRGLFPASTPSELSNLLQKYQNVSAVVEYLLSPSDDTASPAPLPPPPPAQGIAQAKKKKRHKGITVHLNDVRQGGGISESAYQRQRRNKAGANDTNDAEEEEEEIGAWVALDSVAIQLAHLIPPSAAARLRSLYHSYPSLPLALNNLLSSLPPPASLQFERNLKMLSEMYPDQDRQKLRVLLGATGGDGDIDKALDLMQLLRQVGDMGQGLKKDVVGSSFTLTKPSSRTSYANVAGGRTSNSIYQSQVSQTSTFSSSFCKKKIAELEDQRNTLYRTAASMFRSTNQNVKPGGVVYSERAREVAKELEVWQLRYSKALVMDRKRASGRNDCIDLHGVTSINAITVVKELTEEWWRNKGEERFDSRSEPFRIITGVGHGSKNKVPILAPVVTRFLDREQWKWVFEQGDRSSGVILVKGRVR